MSVITYPLNGIEYYARDAAGYTSTRTSGVYSSEQDFPVTPAGGLSVTVGAGQGWVRPARFEGYSIVMREAQTLTLAKADSLRPRIDRIVLRYDAAARQTALQVLQGTPDSSPTAPAITRTALYYDLCLAEITRPAGSTAITAAHIRDTRTNESLCGLMRDGVNSIPTDQLENEARAQLDELKASYTGGYISRQKVTLSASDWKASGSSTYPWACDAACLLCSSEMTPQATILPESTTVAGSAMLAPTCETYTDAVRFFAKNKPAQDIFAQVVLFGPSTGQGSGLSDAEKQLLLSLLKKSVYTDTDAETAYNALADLWKGTV